MIEQIISLIVLFLTFSLVGVGVVFGLLPLVGF
jgi:uncharacterized membrane protein YesL